MAINPLSNPNLNLLQNKQQKVDNFLKKVANMVNEKTQQEICLKVSPDIVGQNDKETVLKFIKSSFLSQSSDVLSFINNFLKNFKANALTPERLKELAKQCGLLQKSSFLEADSSEVFQQLMDAELDNELAKELKSQDLATKMLEKNEQDLNEFLINKDPQLFAQIYHNLLTLSENFQCEEGTNMLKALIKG